MDAREDEIAELRAQLAGLSGTARTRPLLDLGHRCADRYWRTGPGMPAALPLLTECIEALEEAYGYLPAGDQMRGQVAMMLGIQLSTRRGAHNGPETDRDRAIPLLQEAVEVEQLPAVLIAMGRFMLGQLLLDRALRALPSPDQVLGGMGGGMGGMGGGAGGAGGMGGFGGVGGFGGFGGMAGGRPSAAVADVEQAQDCFRRVIADSPVPDMARYAETMLLVSEALAALLGGFGGGGPLGFDLGKMAQAMTTLQGVQQSGGPGVGFGLGMPNGIGSFGMSPAAYAEEFAKISPDQRRMAVSLGKDPGGGAESLASAASPDPAPPVVDVAALREQVRSLLPDGPDVFASVMALLQASEPPEDLDELVALASTAVYSDEEPSGLDQLVLAATLYVRGLRDDGGWGEDDQDEGAEGDLQAAAKSLLMAARMLPAEQPDSIPALVYLATLLPAGTLASVAEHFSPLTELLQLVGADAVILPEPVGSLEWNAVDARLEQAGSSGAERIVVIGDNPPAPTADAVVTCVASLGQLAELAHRKPVGALTGDTVFVVNPRGGREAATVAAMVVRRTFYPGSTGLGRMIEDVGGVGSAEQVRARLGASMLHLDCGVTAEGVLELAEGSELDVAEIVDGAPAAAGGGLAILPPGCFLPLADRLIDAGFSGVVGWRHAVPEPVAAVLVYLLHSALADGGRTPAEALREVRRWIAAPRPEALPTLLAGYAEHLADLSADDAAVMIYRGR